MNQRLNSLLSILMKLVTSCHQYLRFKYVSTATQAVTCSHATELYANLYKMGVFKVNVFILVLFVSLASSRTILEEKESKEIVGVEAPVVKDQVEPVKTPAIHATEYQRIPCEHEKATEDKVCQDHCLPKGYNYGLCVSKTCSCI